MKESSEKAASSGGEGNKPLGEQREGRRRRGEEEGGPQGSRWTRESEGGVRRRSRGGRERTGGSRPPRRRARRGRRSSPRSAPRSARATPAALRRGAREVGRRPGRSRRRRPAAAREFSGFFFGFFFFFFFFAPVRPSRSVRGRGRPLRAVRRGDAVRGVRRAPERRRATRGRPGDVLEVSPGRRLCRRAPGERRLAVVEGARVDRGPRSRRAGVRAIPGRVPARRRRGPGWTRRRRRRGRASASRRERKKENLLGEKRHRLGRRARRRVGVVRDGAPPRVRVAPLAARPRGVHGGRERPGARATRAIARETLTETARVSLALLTAPDAPPRREPPPRATGAVAALQAPPGSKRLVGPAAASEDPSPTPAHTPGAPRLRVHLRSTSSRCSTRSCARAATRPSR